MNKEKTFLECEETLPTLCQTNQHVHQHATALEEGQDIVPTNLRQAVHRSALPRSAQPHPGHGMVNASCGWVQAQTIYCKDPSIE